MRKHLIMYLCFVLVILGSSVAAASSKVLVAPTADITRNGTIEVDFRHNRGLSSLELQAGIYPGISVGVKQNFGGAFFGTARIAFSEEGENRPAFAVGGEFSVEKPNIYAVVSKQLGTPGLRGHLAFGLGRYSRGMAGLTMVLNPIRVNNPQGLSLPTTSLFLDYDGQGLNTGISAKFSPELSTDLAWAFGHGLSFGVNVRLAF